MNDPRSGGKFWFCHCGTRFVPHNRAHRFCAKCSPNFSQPPLHPTIRSYPSVQPRAATNPPSPHSTHQKSCDACSSPFFPARPYFRWCESFALSCSNTSQGLTKPCEVCSSPFSPKRPYFNRCDACDFESPHAPRDHTGTPSSKPPRFMGTSELPSRPPARTATYFASHTERPKKTFVQALKGVTRSNFPFSSNESETTTGKTKHILSLEERFSLFEKLNKESHSTLKRSLKTVS